MIVHIARLLMALAAGSLHDSRPDWAAAMQVEFEEEAVHRTPLAFAIGCLAAACRELPFHSEGRLRLTSWVVALGLIAPIAIINFTCSLPGFRFMIEGSDHYYSLLASGTLQQHELATAYKAAMPVITGLVVLLALLHLLIARAVLHRHFGRVAFLWPVTGLVAGALLVLAIWLFPHGTSIAFTVFVGLAVELASVPLLTLWQHRLDRGARRG